MGKYENCLQSRFQPLPESRLDWLCRLRVAAYLGRRGNVAAVKVVLQEAREAFLDSPTADVYAYINFAEGMVHFSAGRLELCLDRLMRADALRAGCSPSDEIHLLILGWLAHIFRIQGKWARLESALRSCLADDLVVSPEALGRISLVFADGFQQTAQYHIADVWYALARESALACGDDSITGAILFNRPSCRVFNERINRISSIKEATGLRMVSLETDSAFNYSGYVRDDSMPWVFAMLQSHICLLQNSHQRALAHLEGDEWRGFESDWPLVGAQRAADILLCKSHLMLLSREQVIENAKSIYDALDLGRDWGDVAIVLGSLGEAAKGLCSEFETACEQAIREALVKHEKDVFDEACVLDRVTSAGDETDSKSLAQKMSARLEQYKLQRQLM